MKNKRPLSLKQEADNPPQQPSRRQFLGRAGGATAALVAAGAIGLEPLIGSRRSVARAVEISPFDDDRTTPTEPNPFDTDRPRSTAQVDANEAQPGRPGAPQTRAARELERLDRDGDGLVDRREAELRTALADRFDIYDGDGDDRLSRDEFETWLEHYDRGVS